MITYLIIGAVTAAICCLMIQGGKFVARKQVAGSIVSEKERLIGEIRRYITSLEGLAGRTDQYASRKQDENLTSRLEAARSGLETERQSLVTIEANLNNAQKLVEEKEAIQQELKSAKEEDETHLEELLSNYAGVSQESTALEHRLADSLKNLDAIMEQLELNQDQRDLLEELSKALTSAGANLRDLLMEYESVKNRLQALNQQHLDLEEEYTKLVEQQLGE